MKTNEYVKYLTQTVIKYADQPKAERVKSRLEKNEGKSSFLFRWFGILPFVFMSLKKRKR